MSKFFIAGSNQTYWLIRISKKPTKFKMKDQTIQALQKMTHSDNFRLTHSPLILDPRPFQPPAQLVVWPPSPLSTHLTDFHCLVYAQSQKTTQESTNTTQCTQPLTYTFFGLSNGPSVTSITASCCSSSRCSTRERAAQSKHVVTRTST